MVSLVGHPETSHRSGGSSSVTRYAGEVVYIYAFDVAYEMARLPVRELLGHPLAQFSVDASKRSPRQLFFYRPQMLRLPPLERIGPRGPVRLDRVVKLLPVVAVSITVRVPFEVACIEDLVVYHDLQFSNGALHHEVRHLAEEVCRELSPYTVRPIAQLAEEEARSEEHTSELQSRLHLVCRLLLEKKKIQTPPGPTHTSVHMYSLRLACITTQ